MWWAYFYLRRPWYNFGEYGSKAEAYKTHDAGLYDLQIDYSEKGSLGKFKVDVSWQLYLQKQLSLLLFLRGTKSKWRMRFQIRWKFTASHVHLSTDNLCDF